MEEPSELSYDVSFICIILFQTLKTLQLAMNKIGDEGAKHLGNAFHNNTVNSIFFHWYILSLNVDT